MIFSLIDRLGHLRGLLGGLFLIAVGVALSIYAPRMIGWELEPLREWPVLTSAGVSSPGEGVVVEGHIAEDTPLLVQDRLVLGEGQRRDGDGDWRASESFTQPVDVVLADGGRVTVIDATGDVRGAIVELPGEDGQRYVGFERGAAWVVTGELRQASPATVSAAYHYGGSREDYERSLEKMMPFIYALSGGFALLGLLTMAMSVVRAVRG